MSKYILSNVKDNYKNLKTYFKCNKKNVVLEVFLNRKKEREKLKFLLYLTEIFLLNFVKFVSSSLLYKYFHKIFTTF